MARIVLNGLLEPASMVCTAEEIASGSCAKLGSDATKTTIIHAPSRAAFRNFTIRVRMQEKNSEAPLINATRRIFVSDICFGFTMRGNKEFRPPHRQVGSKADAAGQRVELKNVLLLPAE